jgi:hypothetical protein
MYALPAALFLWQKDSFSCRDAHAFNRFSSLQVPVCVISSGFSFVSYEFSGRVSLHIPSSHSPPTLVRLATIEGHSPALLPDLPQSIQFNLTASEGLPPLDRMPDAACVNAPPARAARIARQATALPDQLG